MSKACREHGMTSKNWHLRDGRSRAATLGDDALLPTDGVRRRGRHPEWVQARATAEGRPGRPRVCAVLTLRAFSEQKLPGPKIKDIVHQTYKNQEVKKLHWLQERKRGEAKGLACKHLQRKRPLHAGVRWRLKSDGTHFAQKIQTPVWRDYNLKCYKREN